MTGEPRAPERAPAARTGADDWAAFLRALLGLGLVVATLFGPALAGGRVLFERDILSYWLPQAASFVRAVGGERAPPFWSPLFAFGQPMIEDPSYQVLYPPTWLNLIVGPGVYYTWFVVLHSLVGALGIFCLARRLGCTALPAFAAASAWSASGPLLSAVSLHHHFSGLAWTPWVLLALDGSLRHRAWGDGLILGAAAGAQALAGSGDVCLATGALGAGYLAFWTTGAPPGTRRRALPALVLALAFALGLSAGQTLPTLWLASEAPRVGQGPATSLYWSIHPLSLLDLVVDRAVAGFPMTDSLRALLYESRAPFLTSLYLGLPVAWLVALGLLLPGRPRLAAWALVGFATCVLVGLGRHTPLLHLLLKLPAVGVFRYPAKAMLPASVLWALLAGFGFAAWQRPWAARERRRAALLAALAVGLGGAVLLGAGWLEAAPLSLRNFIYCEGGDGGAAAALAPIARRLRVGATGSLLVGLLMAARCAWRSAPTWLTAAAALLALGDLVLAGRTVNGLAPQELLWHRPPILARLPSDAQDVRVYSFSPQQRIGPVRGPAGWEPSWAAALGAVEALRPPSGARFRLAGSYDGDFTGLAPPALSILTRMLVKQRDTKLATRLLQMGSVDYVVAAGAAPFPDLKPLGEHPSVFASPLRLFRVPDPLPRAFWVGRARQSSTPAAAIEALADPHFDPRREVILPVGSPRVSPDPVAHGVSRISDRRSNRLRIEVSATGPGYLVVVEAYHQGWRATIDGQPAAVMPANALFRAVALPAGRHVVEMIYWPNTVPLGLAISGLTALAGSGAWLASRAAARTRVASSLAAQ